MTAIARCLSCADPFGFPLRTPEEIAEFEAWLADGWPPPTDAEIDAMAEAAAADWAAREGQDEPAADPIPF